MFDVAVVGGGPAGNGVALHLARAGRQVVVLDYRTVLGDKLCTGIVSAECLQEFPPSVNVIRRPGRSATFVSPAGSRLRFERPAALAYVIDRVAYVSDLAKQAEDAGATYVLGRRVENVRREAQSVRLELYGSGEEIEARVVVIATGFNPLLSTRLGLGKPQDHAIGLQVEVAATEVEEVEVYLGNRYAPGFFGWLTPTSQGRGLLGMLSKNSSATGLEALLASLISAGTVSEALGPIQRWGVPLAPLRKTVGDRVLVVGDAAGQVKPSTGGGIYYSLLASRVAAQTINDALRAGDLSERGLKAYETRWRELLLGELRMGARVRTINEHLTDQQIEQLMAIARSSPLIRSLLNSPEAPFDWHGPLLRRLLRHTGAELMRSFALPELRGRAPQTSA